MFGISSFVWENIPFFKYIQFSHRWLTITTFAVVFLFADIFRGTRNVLKTKRESSMLIIILCFIFFASLLLDYKYIRFTHFINEQELLPARDPNWYREHLPIWVDMEEIDKSRGNKQHVVIQEGKGSAEVKLWQSAERRIDIKALEPIMLRIRTFYFPGWKAYLDGVETQIRKEEKVGAMLVRIPKGTHALLLRFEDTPVRHYAKIISLASVLVVLSLVLFPGRRRGQ